MSTTSGASTYDGPLISPTLISPNSPLEGIERQRMSSVSAQAFSTHTIDFDIIDIYDSASRTGVDWKNCDQSNALENILSEPRGVRTRIISIPGLGTTSQLCITLGLVCQMMVHYRVEPHFRDILYSFGQAPRSGEGGCSDVFVNTYEDGSRAVGYKIQYVEENRESLVMPWSRRHTGIYHRSSFSLDEVGGDRRPFDLFILVYSTGNTAFRTQINSLSEGDEVGRRLHRQICGDSKYIHELAIDSHLRNWPWYIHFWADSYDRGSRGVFTNDRPEHMSEILAFKTVRNFRNIKDQVLIAKSFCLGNLSLVSSLNDIYAKSESHLFAVVMQEKMRGYLNSLIALQERIDNAQALLEYALDWKNNQNTLELTKSAVKDSAAVKVITYSGLIFLPGSFVSSVYGMNFFLLDSESRSFVISPMFWIYLTTWIPLTIAVLIINWYFAERQPRRKSNSPKAVCLSEKKQDKTGPVRKLLQLVGYRVQNSHNLSIA